MTSPRHAAHTELRARLLDAARRRLEDDGPEAVRARDLAADVGASTQALYTLFGGMPALIEALVAEGFVASARYIAAVPETDDAVADHLTQGRAYRAWALAHPQLYRLMFGVTGATLRRHAGLHILLGSATTELPEGQAALGVLVDSVARMVDAGRIRTDDPLDAGRQFLAATHGFVLLEIAGAFGDPASDEGLPTIGRLAVNLLVGLGDDREAAEGSVLAAIARPLPEVPA